MARGDEMVEQVLLDILLYLPVMSLLRFKAVCKHWFSLIESSAFISEHLSHNCDNKEDDFIIRGAVKGERFHETKLALLSGSQYECVSDIEIVRFWHPATGDDDEGLYLTGYCNGIICLAHEVKIALWNPALKQLKSLPPPLFYDKMVLINEGHSICLFYTSFGIDVKNNDYKLVRIFLAYVDTNVMFGNQVEVYDLEGDNSWRITHKDDVLPFIEILSDAAVSSGKSGKCFWIARRYDNTAILLSFDFSDEVFRTMLFPNGSRDPCPDDLDLLDDKVVYIVETSSEHGKAFDIWMLHEFGVEESWNIIYKVGPFLYMDSFYLRRISKNGEFLICSKSDIIVRGQLVAKGEHKLYLYNLHTQQGKYIQNCNLKLGTFGFAQLIHYNASLLSLKSKKVVRPTE